MTIVPVQPCTMTPSFRAEAVELERLPAGAVAFPEGGVEVHAAYRVWSRPGCHDLGVVIRATPEGNARASWFVIMLDGSSCPFVLPTRDTAIALLATARSVDACSGWKHGPKLVGQPTNGN